jgi:erythromycin esterase-like protein
MPPEYDPLLARAADASLVLLGEASHGTHEFYRERAEITRRLIAEQGFTGVAVEADWPDAWRVNRFVQAKSDDETAEEALRDFVRFPAWMWRNTEVEHFVEWLRDWNDDAHDSANAGFYGLDLYSLHRSMEAVVEFLQEADPDAALRAIERYSCFDHFGRDPQVYGYETGLGGAEPCEQRAVEQLLELQDRAAELIRKAEGDEDAQFFTEQNARLVVNAERYYRAAFQGGYESWNLRDTHMVETLYELIAYLSRGGTQPRLVVWAHNSHLGDARATEMGRAGELNVGQLVRERSREGALLVGFSTHRGTVTAASDWGAPGERKRVLPALSGSWEELLHQRGDSGALLDTAAFPGRRLERAIGVIYRPETERISHYFHAQLADQFDAVIHIDETSALEPLEPASEWRAAAELPETFPFGV